MSYMTRSGFVVVTCSCKCFVNRTEIDTRGGLFPVGHWDEPHDQHVSVELLGFGFSQKQSGSIKPCPFKK